jgi:ABC-type transport system involved in multi-copper enzyme maturation permease subunit
MTRTLILAENTFREAIRDRLLYVALVFGGIILCGSVLIAPLTLGENAKIIVDLGLSAISVFAVLIVILVGTGLVYKEIERRTIHTVLAQPVWRHEFVLGKFLGLYGVLAVALALLSLFYLLVVSVFANGVQANLLVALLLTFCEAGVVTAIALLFSSVASPLLSAVFTFAIYLLGHLAADLPALAAQTQSVVVDGMVRVVTTILPALHHFEIRNNVLSGVPVPPERVYLCLAYAGLYTATVLLVTIVVFSRRDFE